MAFHLNNIIENSINVILILGHQLFCNTLPKDVLEQCKRTLRCLKCARYFSDFGSLRKHMNYVCQVDPLYKCPYCSHRARMNTLLKYHIMREHANKPANKSFPINYSFNTCLNRKSRTQKQSLNTLIRNLGYGYYQTTSSPHQRFIAPSQAKPQTSKPQHECQNCGAVFQLRALLKSHVQLACKRVQRVDVYQCNQCPYRSSYKANIERHVRNLHDRQSTEFKCKLCNFRSKYSYCVRRHMKTFHPMS
ncbi:hypothetical protein TSAR_011816 [Trichomalopsis sarcophagae]|uniref:C2H2-type domain-containing protein n=1 Tax=Trichomalopsis sarcophagae TaxID=543379 RepID=A0A232F547_9HYME|nr:hypothetical protein TSAR_011816 [Trichomalopsis sarcophagae]